LPLAVKLMKSRRKFCHGWMVTSTGLPIGFGGATAVTQSKSTTNGLTRADRGLMLSNARSSFSALSGGHSGRESAPR